ncbi:MAG: Maf-like protein [Prevotellaceae bacterium]|jgi:septum formation protein|nr:Maf-like protein [Prevotellaceae bacterium]
MLKNYKIILGSQSARRQELMRRLDIDFSVQTIDDLQESYPSDLQTEKIPEYLAKLKADAFEKFLDDEKLLITADTIVIVEGKVLGKPKDEADAGTMLKALSGKTHEVVTGVCLTTKKRQEIFSTFTKVTFATLSDNEIDYYLSKYKPYDKAGSYGIQEWIGFVGVERIEGSFYNVMGFPVQKIYQKLKTFDDEQ